MARRRSKRACCSSNTSVTLATHGGRARAQSSCEVAEKPHQHIHQQMLVVVQSDDSEHSEGLVKEVMMPVAGGRDQDYCDWWHEAAGRDNDKLSLLHVRLIGDASSPQLCAHIAYNDLAYCSKWGHNRVVEHQATHKPINLVLPVLTRPEVVHEAVAGILSGQIGLSMLNVEALLVLANAIGLVSLETTCVEYLSGQAQHMTADGLLALAQLADHLGLSSLLDTAAEHLITLPWDENMSLLCSLLNLSPYTANKDKRISLLHYPTRGAYTELQVLAVLESLGVPRANCASALELQQLQSAELQTLLAALVDSEEDPGPLLRAAVKQQLVPDALRTPPDWTKNVRILHNIMLLDPDAGPDPLETPHADGHFPIPESKLKLRFLHTDQGSIGVYLYPADRNTCLKDIVDSFKFFALHPSQPYAIQIECPPLEAMGAEAGTGWGYPEYLTDLQKLYPSDYPGPFTIGVWWKDRDKLSTSIADGWEIDGWE